MKKGEIFLHGLMWFVTGLLWSSVPAAVWYLLIPIVDSVSPSSSHFGFWFTSTTMFLVPAGIMLLFGTWIMFLSIPGAKEAYDDYEREQESLEVQRIMANNSRS